MDRLPKWVRERGKFTYLIISDALIIGLGYNICFLATVGEWAYITGSVIVSACLYLLSSYVIGRYSLDGEAISVQSIIRKTGIACFMAVALLIIASWLIGSYDMRAQKGFILPVAALTIVLSTCSQNIAYKREINKIHHVYIISDYEREWLTRKELADSHNGKIVIDYKRGLTKELLAGIETPRTATVVLDDNIDITNEMLEVVLDCRAKGMLLMNMKQFFESKLRRLPPEIITSKWLTESTSLKMMPGYIDWRAKRFIDCCGAFALFLITIPLIILAAICIKLEDGGPILFSQIRTGLYGKQFRIWKLRTMTINDNESTRWSYEGDKRVTKIGRFLRKTRIDELPQLINVLRGDMSLIGPRPEQPGIEIELENEIINYRLRHLVRPGISGWAQTCYGYGSSVEESRLKLSYDLYYIIHNSWYLDLIITIKTIKQIFALRGI